MGRRASTSQTTPGVKYSNVIKGGDVIWVPYRKVLWPAIVKKKITYCFLPESTNGSKSPVFKAMPKSVTLFKESDPLPDKASKELKLAYNAALRIARGEMTLIFDTNTGSNGHSKNGTESQSNSPSTSTSSNVILSSRSSSAFMPVFKKAKRNLHEPESSHSATTMLRFRPDDIVMAVRPDGKGKWPALVCAINSTSVCLRLFPLEEPEVIQTVLLRDVYYLPFEEISFICKQVEESNPELHRALLDVRHFLLLKSDEVSAAEQVGSMSLMSLNDVKGREDIKHNKPKNATLNDIDMEEVEAKIIRTTLNSFPERSRSMSLDLKKSKVSLRDLMIGDDARLFMENIWNQRVSSERHKNYKRPISSNLEISFNCGDLMSYQELEKVVAEFQNWIALCTKLPKMSLLTELHYISEVVLPEVCIYTLSNKHDCSREEAEKIFYERSQKDCAFSQLLRAVSIERETMS